MTQVLVNGATLGAIYAIVAIGFSITFLARGFFDFSFAGVIGLVAYCAIVGAGFLAGTRGVMVAILILAAPALSILLDTFVYRGFRTNAPSRLTRIIASLGAMTVIVNFAALFFGDAPLLAPGLSIGGTFSFFGIRTTGWQLATMLICAAIVTGSQALFYHTRWGAKARAVANDRTLAACVGLDVRRISLEVAACGATIGGVAAILSGLDYGLTPMTGFQLLLPAVVASVIGGLGNISGAAATGFLMGIIEQYSAWFLSTAWQESLLLLILVVCLLFRPRGLFGNMLTATSD